MNILLRVKEKTGNAIYIMASILLLLFSSYIFISGFTDWEYAAYLTNSENTFTRVMLILIGSLFLWMFYALGYRLIQRAKESHLKIAVFLLFGILLLLQIVFILIMDIDLRYDPLKVYDEAVSMLSDKSISGSFDSGYFAKYTNNFPITILTYLLLKAASVVGLSSSFYMKALSFVAMAAIDLSVFFGFRLMTVLTNQKRAVLFLLLCTFQPMLIVWSGYYYTATLCMPFFTGSILLFYRILEEKNLIRQLIKTAMLCLLFFIGFKIRATMAILVIAMILVLWMRKKPEQTAAILVRLRKKVLFFCVILLSIMLVSTGYSLLQKKYVTFDYTDTAFPFYHWIMMGANGDGMYNQRDEMYTESLPGKEEKIQGDLQLLKQRLVEAGPIGISRLLVHKLSVTWVDGTSNYVAELSKAQNYSKVSRYITGDKNDLAVYYCQIFQVLMFSMIVIEVGRNLLRFLKHQEKSPLFLAELLLLGGMAFHLIWEANPAYSIGFAVITTMIMTNGLAMSEVISKSAKNWVCILAGLMLCIHVFWFVSRADDYYITNMTQKSWVVNQYLFQSDNPLALSDDERITQTFQTNQAFNFLSLDFMNEGADETITVTVTVTDCDENVVALEEIKGSDIETYVFYRISFEKVIPEGRTEYTVTIQTEGIDASHGLTLLTYDTGHYDAYRNGVFYRDGKETNSDLTFRVGYEYMAPYVNVLKYWILASVVLLLESFFTYRKIPE